MDTSSIADLVRKKATYQYSTITAGRQLRAAAKVLSTGKLSSIAGEYVPRFEQSVAEALGFAGAVATSSATTGLELLLRCLHTEVGRGCVIIPEVCWVSVATAVAHAGKQAVVAPVTEDLTPHWEQIESVLDEDTAAVVLAHVRGRHAPDTSRIASRLAERKIPLIEDCAQAWGVKVNQRQAGGFGTAAVFSTQTYKLIATGEGGAVATDDIDLLGSLRAAGGDTRFRITESGPGRGNCRMSELAAATALAQLDNLAALVKNLRTLQSQVIGCMGQSPLVRSVLPTDPAGSNGSVVGAWFPTPDVARTIAGSLNSVGIPSWWPGPGDPHLLGRPLFRTLDTVNPQQYLDIQIPVLAEEYHDAFLSLVAAALRADTCRVDVGQGEHNDKT